MAPPIKPIVGLTFGRLTITHRIDKDRCICRCACGVEKTFYTANVKRGTSTSCGCYQLESVTTHGDTCGGKKAPEFKIWASMLDRCLRKESSRYAYYGSRGISVCERWRHSYADFLADMGRRPTPDHSIDRIDNNGDYEPSNCRWATRSEQASNTRQTRLLTIEGITKALMEWSREFNVPEYTIKCRLRNGWDVLKAVTTPPRRIKRRRNHSLRL